MHILVLHVMHCDSVLIMSNKSFSFSLSSNSEEIYLNAGQYYLGSTIAWGLVRIIRIGFRMEGN